MNVREALRRADPAPTGAPQLDPSAERLLAQILATAPEPEQSAPAPRRVSGRRRDWRPVLATALVAAAVVTGTVLAIRAVPHGGGTAPAGGADPSSTVGQVLEEAVFAKLDQVADGVVPVRQKSALTWTERSPGASGGGIDTSGRHLYIAAACEGGGSIAIRVTGRSDIALDCTTRSAVGPIDLTAGLDARKQTASLNVVATSGHPEYVAKAMAFAG